VIECRIGEKWLQRYDELARTSAGKYDGDDAKLILTNNNNDDNNNNRIQNRWRKIRRRKGVPSNVII
jgi:hypothetical protein